MSAKSQHQYVFPDDSRWDDARQSWNLAADLRPAVVVLPAAVEDVTGAVAYAAERDLQIVVQGTGHGVAVHGSVEGRSCSTCARCVPSRSTPRTAAPASRPVRCGRTSSRRPPSRA